MLVSTTPLAIEGIVSGEVPLHGAPLILCLSDLPWEDMHTVRAWDSEDAFVVSLGGDCGASARATLLRLLEDADGFELPPAPDEEESQSDSREPDEHERARAHFARWSAECYVRADEKKNGATAWTLTPSGFIALVAGTRLTNPTVVLQGVSEPYLEMSHWQLIYSLDLAGWTMNGIYTKDGMRRVRRRYYDAGDEESPKEWYVHPSTTDTANLPRAYLIALLTAKAHGQRVPHLRPAHAYKRLLDPAWKPRPTRQRQRAAPEIVPADADDAWDDPVVVAQAAAPARAPKKARLKLATEPVVAGEASEEGSGGEGIGGSEGGSGK